MTPHDAAQKMITTLPRETALERAALLEHRPTPMAPFSVEECHEIGRLVRQALDPNYVTSQAEYEALKASPKTRG